MDPELEAVRTQSDPLVRARMATELLRKYMQRTVEVAQLRRSAIQQARRAKRMSDAEIAHALGITRGRLSQIVSGKGML